MDHAQGCKLGGFIYRRHDDTVEGLAHRMKQGGYDDVEVEPPGCKSSRASGSSTRPPTTRRKRAVTCECATSGPMRKTHSLTEGVLPAAPLYRSRKLVSLCKSIAADKKRKYEERITPVEHGTFTPLTFPSSGGKDPEATVVVKKLAADIATKRKEPYSSVVSVLRIKIAFSLARSADFAVCEARDRCAAA